MKVRISDASLLSDLADFLHELPGLVVDEVAADELEVTILGSYSEEGHRMALDLRVRGWQAIHPGVTVDLTPGSGQAVSP